MSCAKRGYGKAPASDDYQYAQFGNTRVDKPGNRCLRLPPSFKPVLSNLSSFSGEKGATVYVYGMNYLPEGTSVVQFGTGSRFITAVTFFSSFCLSFQVPLDVEAGKYQVRVVNIDRGTGPNMTCPGTLTWSDALTFTIL